MLLNISTKESWKGKMKSHKKEDALNEFLSQQVLSFHSRRALSEILKCSQVFATHLFHLTLSGDGKCIRIINQQRMVPSKRGAFSFPTSYSEIYACHIFLFIFFQYRFNFFVAPLPLSGTLTFQPIFLHSFRFPFICVHVKSFMNL